MAGTAACGSDAAPAGAAGGGRGGGGARPPMPVEFAQVKRADVAERVQIVGNLIGAATVEAVPRVNGRLAEVNVRLGDGVRKGQAIARIEDREIREQVRQAEASYKVAQATIRQREADLKFA
jgi:multidrug efflux pump subunit AcrA (membrane-fusion protein)